MLTMPIERKWLDMIISGEKTEEYREIKPYWTIRFQRYFTGKAPRPVRLKAGYNGRRSPHADVMCTVSVGTGRPEWGAEPGKVYYVLRIHRVAAIYNPAEHLDGYKNIYLAGKITGDDDYQEKFEAASRLLEELGYNVYNPATAPEGMTREWYMRKSFETINAADTVFFLPDWEESDGAKLEYAYAKYIGKPIRRIVAMG